MFGFLTDTNTVEIKEHVCREKLVRPSGCEFDANVKVRTWSTANGKLKTSYCTLRFAVNVEIKFSHTERHLSATQECNSIY